MKACNQLCPWNTLYGCKKPENEPCILSNVPCESFEQKPHTNADHIRSMADEELAQFLTEDLWECHKCPEHERLSDNPLMRGEKCDGCCSSHCSDWLKQPYEEES